MSRPVRLFSLPFVLALTLLGSATAGAGAAPTAPAGTQLIEQFTPGGSRGFQALDSGYGYATWLAIDRRHKNHNRLSVLSADGTLRHVAVNVTPGDIALGVMVRRIDDRSGVPHVVNVTNVCGHSHCYQRFTDLASGAPFAAWWTTTPDLAILSDRDVEDGVVVDPADDSADLLAPKCSISLRALADDAVLRTLPPVPDCSEVVGVYLRGPIVAVRGRVVVKTAAETSGIEMMAIDTSAPEPRWVRLDRQGTTLARVRIVGPGVVTSGELLALEADLSGRTFRQVGPTLVHRWDLSQLAAAAAPAVADIPALAPVEVALPLALAADLDGLGTTGTDLIALLQRASPTRHDRKAVLSQVVRVIGSPR